MEHKAFLPNGLKNIFNEEENVCSKTIGECKAIEEIRTESDRKNISGRDNKE